MITTGLHRLFHLKIFLLSLWTASLGMGKQKTRENTVLKMELAEQTGPDQGLILRYKICVTHIYEERKKLPPQTLDGKFAEGKTENQGEYSAKDGAGRANQARPGTNIKVSIFVWLEIIE